MPAESYPRYSSRFNPCRRSGFEARLPTYPMIPHIWDLLEKRQSPADRTPSPRRDGSAELSSYEGGDASTGLLRHSLILRLRQDADQGLGSGRSDQNAAAAGPLPVQFLDCGHDCPRQFLLGNPNVLLCLRIAGHDGCDLTQLPALQRSAQEQPCSEAVAGHMVAQEDDVAGLLAAEDRAFALQRLEHVPVADIGGVHANAALVHQGVEP